MKKLITAFVTLKEGKNADFKSVAAAVVAGSNAEEGCISYQLFQDPANENKFVILEQWKDQAAIDYHFKTPHFIELGEKLNSLVAEPLKIVIYDIAGETQA